MYRFILISVLYICGRTGAEEGLETSVSEEVSLSPSIFIDELNGGFIGYDSKADQKVVILIDSGKNQLLKDSLQNAYTQQSANLFATRLQYNNNATGIIPEVENLVEFIGDYVANFIFEMCINNTIDIKNLELVCHGSNCHAAGSVGKKLKLLKYGDNAFFKIPKIILLDPTGLEHTEIDTIQREDADKLVVFHTNGGFLGDWRKLGELDIYLNGGVNQPGCSSVEDNNECSHEFAHKYYTELLTNPSVMMTVYDYETLENVKKTKPNYMWNSQYEQISSLDQLLSKTGSYVVKTTPKPYRLDEIHELQMFSWPDNLCEMAGFNPYEHIEIELFAPKKKDPLPIKYDDFEKLDGEYFNKSWPTKMVIHGWMPFGISSHLGELYAKSLHGQEEPKNNINLIHINWKAGAEKFYAVANTCVQPVGKYAAHFIYLAEKAGKFNRSTLDVIGHSLGAHAAGWVGKTLYEKTGIILPKITALDPAGPMFLFYLNYLKLTRTDAHEVYVIHTDGRPTMPSYGHWNLLGTVDLYINGGMIQKLKTNIQSHNWAVEFHRTILTMNKPLIGYKFSFKEANKWMCGLLPCTEKDRLKIMKEKYLKDHSKVTIFYDAKHPIIKKDEAVFVDSESLENRPKKGANTAQF